MKAPARPPPHPLEALIGAAWDRRATLDRDALQAVAGAAVAQALALLESGECRVAEPDGAGGWRVNAWLKQAVLLHFRLEDARPMEIGRASCRERVLIGV